MDFQFRLVGKGWAEASLSSEDTMARITASYLGDALGDLLLAVWTMVEGDTDARCSWWEEPGEYRWLFHRQGDSVTIKVLDFPQVWSEAPDEGGKQVFEWIGQTTDLRHDRCRCSFAVLAEYGERGYKATWIEHDFPIGTLRLLDETLARTGDIRAR